MQKGNATGGGSSRPGPSSASTGSSVNANGKRSVEAVTDTSAGNSQHRKANQATPRRDYSKKIVSESYIEYGKIS